MITIVLTNGTTLNVDADRMKYQTNNDNVNRIELYDTIGTDGFFPVATFNFNNIAGFISKKPIEIEEKVEDEVDDEVNEAIDYSVLDRESGAYYECYG